MFPGQQFILNGGKIKDIVEGPTTERLLIVGTAVDGPLNTPIEIRDARQLELVFGPAKYAKGYKDPNSNDESGKPNGATIPLAVAEALKAGATDIVVVRATGQYAAAASAFSNKLEIQALYPGRIYNDVTLKAQIVSGSLQITLSQPLVKGGAFTKTYAGSTTLGEMIDDLNSEPRNTTILLNRDAFPSTVDNLVTTLVATGAGTTVALSGGTNGTNARGEDLAGQYGLKVYQDALVAVDSGTYDSLLGRSERFDKVVLTGIHLDDQIAFSGVDGATSQDEYQKSAIWDYLYFLDDAYTLVGPCHGVIGTRPTNLRSEASVISWVNNNLLETDYGFYNQGLKWIKAGPFLYEGFIRNDPSGNGAKDMGFLLSVVAGPDAIYSHPDVGRYNTTIHVGYAAFLCTLKPTQSAVRKQIPGPIAYGTLIPSQYARKLVQGVGYDGERDLSGRGAYVVLTRNPSNGTLVVFDDATATYRDEILRSEQIVHVGNNIHLALEEALSQFIGGSSDDVAKAAMDSRVQNVLDGYVQTGALKGGKDVGYTYKLWSSGNEAIMGVIRCDVEIWPANAIKQIKFAVNVRQ